MLPTLLIFMAIGWASLSSDDGVSDGGSPWADLSDDCVGDGGSPWAALSADGELSDASAASAAPPDLLGEGAASSEDAVQQAASFDEFGHGLDTVQVPQRTLRVSHLSSAFRKTF